MWTSIKAVVFSKSGLSVLIGFLTVLLANFQGALGENGDQMTIAAAFAAAFGLAIRHTAQKIMDLVVSKFSGGDSTPTP